MLETKFKIAFLLVVLFMASLPVIGIFQGTSRPPVDPTLPQSTEPAAQPASTNEAPVAEEMIAIAAGSFTRGTTVGGYDEQPERPIHLDAFSIDRYEATNHQYRAFVAATGHRKAAPPSRYAKNMSRMGGVNQPVAYVSWEDAEAYCRWKGKRLPTEAEWEKAMRGLDGRLWPWGNDQNPMASNWGAAKDGYEATAPVGAFKRDVSPFGVADGAGNVMEWVADWYAEDAYREPVDKNPKGPDHGVYRVMRGGGYTTSGSDVRITSRSKMVPDFRDETIGFRCAISGVEDAEERGAGGATGARKS
ncbi:MAG: SUMF1/EgtB/PvdO family nonheme iron enzyme [Nitrospirae bacterium]|nr:SUMF1/EgtB/PvdO family nonheme iron enzyme [Nitrospirota bacterium]